jgi:hypothetical protein
LLLPLPNAAASAQQLVSQVLAGTQRLCLYANPNLNRRSLQPYVRHSIGRGEPCPGRYPGRPQTSATAIPSMALFLRERRVGGQRFCDYRYFGQIYQRPMTNTQPCPRTPNFPY